MSVLNLIKGYLYYIVLSLSCLNYPETTYRLEVNGQSLLCAERGKKDGKPVILIHGNGGSHKDLFTQAKFLAKKGYRVYSFDSRGQGDNKRLNEYHYEDMVEDTYQYIKALNLDKPAVYGWSDGGIISLMLESEHPGTLGLFGASGANLSPDCGDNFEAFKEWILNEGTPLALMMLDEPNIDPASLKAIKCPALIVAGEHDIISEEHAHLIADNIPDSELVFVPGEDHGSYIIRSPKMNNILLDFFKRHNY